MLPFALCCAAALALGVVLQALMPNGFSLRGASGNAAVEAVAEIHASSTVQLNEIMSSNNRLFLDAAGNTPDWIELRNASDSAVDLAGWTLARNATESHMFVFPAQTLAPGECVLVFADSTYSDSADGYHAPFSLKAEGDTPSTYHRLTRIPSTGAWATFGRYPPNTRPAWKIPPKATRR